MAPNLPIGRRGIRRDSPIYILNAGELAYPLLMPSRPTIASSTRREAFASHL